MNKKKGWTRKGNVNEGHFEAVKMLKSKGLKPREIASVVGFSYGTVIRMLIKPDWKTYIEYKEKWAKYQADKKLGLLVEPTTTPESQNLEELPDTNDEGRSIYQVLLSIEANLNKLVLMEERKEVYRHSIAEKKHRLFQ